MKNLFILFFVGVLVGPVQGVTAQELLVPPAEGPMAPPPMELPAGPDAGFEMQGSGSRGEFPAGDQGQSMLEPIAAGDLQPNLQPYETGSEYQILDCEPALLESTGTWLRRGFWYTEIDALLMDLIWSRDGRTLALQGGTTNTLIVQGGRSGAEVLPRLKLGRFLFRDHKNRDHTAEFVASGGGQWTHAGRLDAVGGGTLTVLTAGGNTSFSGATSMQINYDSRFNNFELNYHVKSRMEKDRMELEPSGHWVRRAQPTMTRSLMAGIRYFNLQEDFNWDAFGIDSDNNAATAAETGNYRIKTNNDLIGTQIGFSWNYESARWSLGLQNKNGIYLNRSNIDSSFAVTGGVTAGDTNVDVDNLSFITEASVLGKWHLRPNFSLRAGIEILYVTSVAHAADQVTFIPVSTTQAMSSGHSAFMGGTIGFEGYW